MKEQKVITSQYIDEFRNLVNKAISEGWVVVQVTCGFMAIALLEKEKI